MVLWGGAGQMCWEGVLAMEAREGGAPPGVGGGAASVFDLHVRMAVRLSFMWRQKKN